MKNKIYKIKLKNYETKIKAKSYEETLKLAEINFENYKWNDSFYFNDWGGYDEKIS